MIPFCDSIEGSFNTNFYIPLNIESQLNTLNSNKFLIRNINNKNFINNIDIKNNNIISINENINLDINNNNHKGKFSSVINKLELNYGLIQFAFFNLIFSLMIISLILTILKNPGDLEDKYVNLKNKIKY